MLKLGFAIANLLFAIHKFDLGIAKFEKFINKSNLCMHFFNLMMAKSFK